MSNNVAVYHGIREAVTRALRAAPEHYIFEVDSLLIARQLSSVFEAFHSVERAALLGVLGVRNTTPHGLRGRSTRLNTPLYWV